MRPEQCVARPACHMIRRCRRINKVNQFLGTFRLFVGHEKALRSINRKRPAHRLVFTKQKMVGMTGFEPAASSSRTMRATKLRHIPTTICILASFVGKCKHYFRIEGSLMHALTLKKEITVYPRTAFSTTERSISSEGTSVNDRPAPLGGTLLLRRLNQTALHPASVEPATSRSKESPT